MPKLTVNKLNLLSLVLFVFFLSLSTDAAVTQLGTATSVNNSNSHSFTVPAGTNRMLLVVVSDDNGTDISSAAFGSSGMIQRAERNDTFAVDSVWTLNLGTSASPTTGTITASTNGTGNLAFIAAVAFQGVDQTTPVSNAQAVNNTTIPSASTLNITSATGNLVFDIFDVFGFSVVTVTPGASQTVIHNSGTVTLGAGGLGFYRTSIRSGAATVPMSWTTNKGSALIHIGLSINAATSSANVSVRGRVLDNRGRGLKNAMVTITNSSGQTQTAITTAFGYYRFINVQPGGTYIIGVAAKKYTFSTQTVNVSSELADVNFTPTN